MGTRDGRFFTVVGLAALLAGCGGSGGSATHATHATHAAKLARPTARVPVDARAAPFAARAGAICAAANHQIAALPAAYATPTGAAGTALEAAAYARIGTVELSQLKALAAPAARANAWARFLAALAAANDSEGAIVAEMRGTYAPAPGQQPGVRSPTAAAGALGIAACAEGAVPSAVSP